MDSDSEGTSANAASLSATSGTLTVATLPLAQNRMRGLVLIADMLQSVCVFTMMLKMQSKLTLVYRM